MRRASSRTRIGIATLTLALLWSMLPVAMIHISVRAQDSSLAATSLAHTTEVEVKASPTGVLIEWRTSFLLDNLGFNIYREQGGKRTQVNGSIIAGSALSAGQGTSVNTYEWFDGAGTLDARYYLEDASLSGRTDLIGPFTPIWSAALTKTQPAKLISQIASQADSSAQAEGPAGSLDQAAQTTAAIQDQWPIAAQPGLKIGVKQNGWYRVTQAEMAAAGFDISGDAKNLRLFVDAKEIPIEVSRDSGQLGSSDFIEFYGTGLDTPTADTHVYYLVNGTQPGLRITVFGEIHPSGSPAPASTPSDVSAPVEPYPAIVEGSWRAGLFDDVPFGVSASRGETGRLSAMGSQSQTLSVTHNSLPVVSSGSAGNFLYEVQRKERFIYFSGLLNGPAENFFGDVISLSPLTKTLNVSNLQTNSQGTAQLRIGLQGTSNQTHKVNVFLNDVMIGSVSFDSLVFGDRTFNLDASQLREGSNDIKFVKTSSGDIVLYSYASLTYPRLYRASNDTLSFILKSTQSATVDGFTTQNVRVLDISNPASVQEVHTIVVNSSGGYALTVPSTGVKSKGARTLLALPTGSFLHPASVSFNQPSTLNQSNNAADLVIISHQSFIALNSLAALVAQRQAQGFTVKIVDVEDVFDEFSYGAHTPQAITDFLALARTTWSKSPRYLLLIGDGSYDYRNYTGNGNFDLVPTKLVDTAFSETASDDTLTDFDGDGIPEIPVGRLPVRTTVEANLVLSKIVNFSPSNVPQNALMVADTQGSYYWNFEASNEQLITLLPASMQSNVQRVYRRLEPSDVAARADIINKFNQGPALVNYSGHGNVDVWTGAPIFNNSDAMALTNGNKLPLVVVMDCLNGYFVAPSLDCIGESLLKAPNGGSVASFVSSGLTIPDGQHAMGQRLFELLYGSQPIALGDATRQAKLATTDLDVRRTWILLGDPTMKIR